MSEIIIKILEPTEATSPNEVVIILGGGDKNTQAQDITNAKQLWREYKNEIERFSRDF